MCYLHKIAVSAMPSDKEIQFLNQFYLLMIFSCWTMLVMLSSEDSIESQTEYTVSLHSLKAKLVM